MSSMVRRIQIRGSGLRKSPKQGKSFVAGHLGSKLGVEGKPTKPLPARGSRRGTMKRKAHPILVAKHSHAPIRETHAEKMDRKASAREYVYLNTAKRGVTVYSHAGYNRHTGKPHEHKREIARNMARA